jgi:hypothetical protein
MLRLAPAPEEAGQSNNAPPPAALEIADENFRGKHRGEMDRMGKDRRV